MKIQISIKNVYGNELIYPECEQSRLFAKIAGTKTLTRHVLSLIQKMGYAIQIYAETSDFCLDKIGG